MSTALEKEEIENIRYTYADYLAWDTEERYEIIGGEAYMMSAPTVARQTISGELFGQFWNFLKGKPCQVFAAPLDVRLFPQDDDSDDTVVQPDLLVVCDGAKLADRRACRGTPDLVVEIVSSPNTSKAQLLKFNRYLRAGVREIWLIEPETRETQVHVAEEQAERTGGGLPRYMSSLYQNDEPVDVSVLPGLRIDFGAVWNSVPGDGAKGA
ncbi:MAG: Uma2 family endonuclease [Treponema sp.]|nr:Uma2 family endonuclease [Treponema sp.]